MLQAKIERAVFAMESCVDIGQGCLSFCSNHKTGFDACLTACDDCVSSLDTQKMNTSWQLKSIRRVERRLQDTLNLVCRSIHSHSDIVNGELISFHLQLSKILIFRNEVLLQNSNGASYDALSTLLHIAQQSRNQQETLAQLLGAVQADSVLLKALSIVATVYLPASLVAVSNGIMVIHIHQKL